MQISHITFIVHDIERTTVMLQLLFDAKVIYDSGKNTFSLSQERFFDIDGLWLVIMQGESLKETTYNHIAFKIDEKEYDEYKKRIETLGLMLMYGKEASNRKQEIDRQHYTIPNQRPKDKHCGKI